MNNQTLFTEPAPDFAGYIFDLDGTLVDSMPQHFAAWNKAMAEVDLPLFSEADFYACGGRSGVEIVTQIAAELERSDIDPEKVSARKRELYVEEMQLTPVRPIEPVVEFARRQKGNVPIAIATGSMLSGAQKTLAQAGLSDLFDVIVTPEDVVLGKPAPDIFLKAAERLGVDPKQCCVFEDADPGVVAARAAGMEVVRIPRIS